MTSSPIQGFMMPNDNVVSSTSEMCDGAKSFYQEQFSEHKSTSSTIEIEAENVDSILRIHMSDNIPTAFPIEIKDIRRTIASLKNKSSTGLDGVSNKIIKLLPPSHQSIICTSFKSFASQLIFPPHWKVAKMILLPKTKSNIVKVEETRPISLLPCFSKLYEKIFLVQFRKWVNDAGILPEEQTGFRPGGNMIVRLVSIIDQIGQCLALNTAAAALFVDFKAAFNQLWYQGLWLKLHKMDCPTYLVGWLRSYLSGRSAYIDMKEARSSAFNLYKGVPQGSCVGPVIFIVYHHDLLNCMSLLHWKHLFADDLSVIIAPSATWPTKTLIPNLLERLKVVIASLITYTTMWKQPINFEKTQWTLFHRQVAPKIPLVTCDGYEIAHTNYIETKIRKNLAIFKRLASSRMLSEEVAYQLYNAYIRPHYQSLLNIYPLLSISKQNKLEALNRQVFRSIHGWYDATNTEVSNLLKNVALADRCYHQSARFCHRNMYLISKDHLPL
ncbi:unnamed protein product, partial [Rotaria socialis]